MKKHLTFHWQRKLLFKLIIAWLILVLPMCVLSVFSNTHEQKVILNTVLEQQRTNIAFYLDSLEVEILRLQKIAYAYSQDSDFKRMASLTQWASNYNRVSTVLSIRDKLALVKQISPYVENLYAMFPRQQYAINGKNSDDKYDSILVDQLLARATLTNIVIDHQKELFVRAASPILVLPDLSPNLLIVIQLNPVQIRTNLIKAAGEGAAMLWGENWNITSQDKPSVDWSLVEEIIRNTAQKDGAYQDDEHLYVWQTSDILGTTLVFSLPQRAVLQGLWDAEQLLYLLIAAQCLCMVIAVSMLYISVHKPIRRMTKAFTEIEQGEQNVRLSTNRKDEFQDLYAGFNRMMDQQKLLSEQMMEQKLLSQQSQLKQLQMQINPHFFYNSFFAVRAMIEMDDTDTAIHMLECLGQYFRFITRTGRETLPLEQEVMYARAYCNIQQIRFENIQVEFEEIPDSMKAVVVPRLILQPLIENAYVHGLESRTGECRLSVSFTQADRKIYIHVENNGMEDVAQCVAIIREKLETGASETTAVLNIHRRLQLYYGSDAGIQVSEGSFGMRVTLVIVREE